MLRRIIYLENCIINNKENNISELTAAGICLNYNNENMQQITPETAGVNLPLLFIQ